MHGHCDGMNTSVVIRLTIGILVATVAGCSGQTQAGTESDGGASTKSAIGAACIPAAEKVTAFHGSSEREINIETRSPTCESELCLSNHFRGRVTCPYGQDSSGNAPPGAKACTTPDGAPIANDAHTGASVPAQCLDRTADKAVYCSCRCANAQGRTDDGAHYCACPSGLSCKPLVTAIGANDDDLAGAYCIKDGTDFDPATTCAAVCDPQVATCR